jgi:hypothetical protein
MVLGRPDTRSVEDGRATTIRLGLSWVDVEGGASSRGVCRFGVVRAQWRGGLQFCKFCAACHHGAGRFVSAGTETAAYGGLDGGCAGFAGSNADGFLGGENKNFAIADLAGLGGVLNG